MQRNKHQEPSCPARVCAHARPSPLPPGAFSAMLTGITERILSKRPCLHLPNAPLSQENTADRRLARKETETAGQHKRFDFLSQPASGLFSLCSHSECQQRHPRSNSCVLESFGWQPRPPQAPPSWPAPGVWSPGSQQGLHAALPSHCRQQSWPWAAHTQGHCRWHSPEAGAGIALGLLGAAKGLTGPCPSVPLDSAAVTDGTEGLGSRSRK